MPYDTSHTWQRTLGSTDRDPTVNACIEQLRTSYRSTRDKAEVLAATISHTLPFFTQHDITHIDALWDAADTLLWDDYPLNPAEGYVLGLSFLLHDLGMALAAYTEGPDGIRNLDFFRDAVASAFLQEQGRPIRSEDWEALEEKLAHLDGTGPAYLNRALADTLRELHAEKAETLGVQDWKDGTRTEYLIDDAGLREAFGELAGQIAASHGWSYDRLKAAFPDSPQGTPGDFPLDWEVDARKLACILRAADAIQIDDRRAPSFLMTLRKLEGESRDHWTFQNRLNQPSVREERLFFTSKSAFPLDAMEAWWLCHDTLQMVDRELRDADTLLLETGRSPFRVRGVYGLSSAGELSRCIQVRGWLPMDTTIRVGDVGRLVEKLGGARLYGKNSEWVPFRELIQNGADAIRARRLADHRPDDYGDVVISLDEVAGKHWVSCTDNGVGMSERVLTGPFLDFGQSFWNTPLMNRELPGLGAKGFQSTGQYGIGFYSVFMWSKEVRVITRRYDLGREKTLVLEFRQGTGSRPVLREATRAEQDLVRDGGTRVEICVSEELAEKIRSGKSFSFGENLARSLAMFAPCLDCNLYYKNILLEKANDWIKIAPEDLMSRVIGEEFTKEMYYNPKFSLFIKNMSLLYEGDCPCGRAFLWPYRRSYRPKMGVIVSGGFQGQERRNFYVGLLFGKQKDVSRNSMISYVHEDAWRIWAENQRERIVEMKLEGDTQIMAASQLALFGIFPHELYIAKSKDGYYTYESIVENVRKSESNYYVIINDATVATDGEILRGAPFSLPFKDFSGVNLIFTVKADAYNFQFVKNHTNLERIVEYAIFEGLDIDKNKLECHTLKETDNHPIASYIYTKPYIY